MLEGNFWAIKNVRLTLIAPLIVATASVSFAPRAEAAGTVAGSTIANTATANYTDSGGNAQTATSNTANLRVDELLDVAVTSADPGDIPTLPSGVNQVASFTVTNTGNGSEAYGLAVTTALGGDQFDPTTTSVMLDTNGNGVYDAGVDTVYAAGTNDPVLAPDASIRVFVLSTIPGTAVNGDRGQLSLAAASRTLTGAPGASANGQGQGGGDAVVGTSGGDGSANPRWSSPAIGWSSSSNTGTPARNPPRILSLPIRCQHPLRIRAHPTPSRRFLSTAERRLPRWPHSKSARRMALNAPPGPKT